MGGHQFPVLSEGAGEEPMLQVQIGGKEIMLMVDTGATFTCVNQTHAQHLPLSSGGKVAKTVGFSGQMQLIPFTDPVLIRFGKLWVEMPILISEHTPINLMGRDMLCGLGLQITCTSAGLSLVNQMSMQIEAVLSDKPLDQASSQTLDISMPKNGQVFWLGCLGSEWESRIFRDWGERIYQLQPNLRQPQCPTHCTVMFRNEPDEKSEDMWKAATGSKHRIPLTAQCIVIAKEGVAAKVKFPSGWRMGEMYDVPCSAPHITLRVGRGYRAREMGRVMLKSLFVEWKDTDIADLQIAQAGEDTLHRIKHKAELCGQPMIVEIEDTPQTDVFSVEYVEDCPFGNPYCLYGVFPGSGYRCWTTNYHKPFTKDDPDWEIFTEHKQKRWLMWKVSNCSKQSLMAMIGADLNPITMGGIHF